MNKVALFWVILFVVQAVATVWVIIDSIITNRPNWTIVSGVWLLVVVHRIWVNYRWFKNNIQ